MKWGKILEPILAQEYANETGITVHPNPDSVLYKHPNVSYMICHPDRMIECQKRGPGVLSIKTASAFVAKQWSQGEVPLPYLVQLQHELEIVKAAEKLKKIWGSLCVLIDNSDFRIIDFEYNEGFLVQLRKKEEEFWRYVDTKTPPPATSSALEAFAFSLLYPTIRPEVVALPPRFTPLDARLEEIDAAAKILEDERELIRNNIKAELGENGFGIVPGRNTKYVYAEVNRKGYEVKPSTYRTLKRVEKD